MYTFQRNHTQLVDAKLGQGEKQQQKIQSMFEAQINKLADIIIKVVGEDKIKNGKLSVFDLSSSQLSGEEKVTTTKRLLIRLLKKMIRIINSGSSMGNNFFCIIDWEDYVKDFKKDESSFVNDIFDIYFEEGFNSLFGSTPRSKIP
jgi:hypothetical protein